MCGPLPLGVVLAGGRGRRLGGRKPAALLCGRPLVSYPLAALRAVLPEVVLLAKEGTELPRLPATTVWIERETRQHPLVGLLEALTRAAGRSVLVCAVDLPLVSPTLVERLAVASPESALAVVASNEGSLQPLLGRYSARAVEPLRGADPEVPLREAVGMLSPALLEVGDPLELFNVNSPEDLERAAELLRSREL